MNVLMIEPGALPRQTEIQDSLAAMQQAVGGPIQAIYPFPEPVALICHEEGKLIGLPLNRALRDEEDEIYDIIAGPIVRYQNVALDIARRTAIWKRSTCGPW